jgi:aryl carrier-like protein
MTDETNPPQMRQPMTREGMRADLARLLRMPPEEIGDEDDLADLGLDSLRAMGLVMRWTEAGLPLDFGELAEALTLNAWWTAAEHAMARANHG